MNFLWFLIETLFYQYNVFFKLIFIFIFLFFWLLKKLDFIFIESENLESNFYNTKPIQIFIIIFFIVSLRLFFIISGIRISFR
jgi:hypothetical protein